MASLTPFQQDLRRLAAGVLYMNMGRAAPNFPTSTRAHPSYQVFVDLTPPADALRDPLAYLFPFKVSWVIWQRVIVPLFEDGSVLVKVVEEVSHSLRHPMNQLRWSQDLLGLIQTIEKELLVAMETEGFLPDSTLTTGYIAEVDGPLVYKRDTELKAQEAEIAAAETAYSAWAGDLVAADNLIRLTGTITAATPPPPIPDPTFPYDENVVRVVDEPDAPGEPVVRAGTVKLVYEQFDT